MSGVPGCRQIAAEIILQHDRHLGSLLTDLLVMARNDRIMGS
jgi:hypothetical protein